MFDNNLVLFIVLVFITVFILTQIIVTPTFGTNRADSSKLRERLQKVILAHGDGQQSIVKDKYLKQLSPVERWFEGLPGMPSLKVLLEQAGKEAKAYRVALFAMSCGGLSAILVWVFYHNILAVLVVPLIVMSFPVLRLLKQRKKRLDKFEEQLPEALEMMTRALRTGYPFNECMNIVASEMDEPIAREFGMTFEEINYGRDVEVAFALMIERVPSVSLIAMVAAILIQRETGGNLSEVFAKINSVVRGRFKLQRRVKTLSAEGRISAWVLALMPFVMFGALHLLNPNFYKPIFEHPNGAVFFYILFTLELLGALWVRKIVNIDV